MLRRKKEPVQYRTGDRIRTDRPLLLVNVQPEQWAYVHIAYPELRRVGMSEAFRKQPRIVINPPTSGDQDFLRIVARGNDETHRNYVFRRRSDDRIAFIVQHVTGPTQALLHIYRANDD